MNQSEKERLIADMTALLRERISTLTATPTPPIPAKPKSDAVEMLTIQECSQAVKGLSVHTVRQLIAQGKIPSIRTGQGKNGKILVSKSALLAYFDRTPQ